MKKITTVLLLILALVLPLALTSCDDVKDAYYVACQNGFTGTVDEWLASLKGDDAYQVWLSLGNTGSREDFINSLSNTVYNYDVTVNASDSTPSVSKGLLSVVSIRACFEGGRGYEYGGSGVIYKLDKLSGDAYIITNHHVVYSHDSESINSGISQDIDVYIYGREYPDYAIPATYIGGSKYYDIAVLRVENSGVLRSSAAMAAEIDLSGINVGETAIAIGNPEALGISATSGIICVDSENITMSLTDNSGLVSMRVFRVDTAINSGNSGGGIFSAEGKLLGISNAKIIDYETENVAYAIPASIAVSVAQNIIDHCDGTQCRTMQRYLMGITVGIADSAAVYDTASGTVSIVESVLVSAITPGGLSDGKLQIGDVIRSIKIGNSVYPVTRTFHVVDTMLNARVGDRVILSVVRGGTLQTVELVITEDCVISY